MNTAIIAAAGQGTRLDPKRPKQFLELLGKPVIIHTLERFDSCSAIDQIVLVSACDKRGEAEALIENFNIRKARSVVTGGETRAESVHKGLDAVDPATEIVAVHDGARPLVSVDEIMRTIDAASKSGAACLVSEVTDTIKEIDGQFVSRTVDRSRLRRALTPQAFRYEILKKAFDGADLTDTVTDECYLVEKLGVEIALVDGSARNIKITRVEDLILAEAFLTQQH